MGFAELLRGKCGALPFERIEIVKFAEFDLAAVRRGVLFVFAEWSPQAYLMFQMLCKATVEAPLTNFRVMVLNADDYDPEAFSAVFGEVLRGSGESFWIKDGRVVYFHKGVVDANPEKAMQQRIQEITEGVA